MTIHRIEITLSDDRLEALDAARGHEPRASFIKRALESALSAAETRELGAHAKLAEAKRDAERKLATLSATPSAFAMQQALNDAKAKDGKR